MGRLLVLVVATLALAASVYARNELPAHVRFVHAVPDAPAMDVYIGDAEEPIVAGIEFAKVTGFHKIQAVNHSIWISQAGAGRAQARQFGPIGPFQPGKFYTIGGVGVLRLDKVQMVLKQDHVTPTWKGSKIKFVNFAPELSFMDVVNVEEDLKGNIHQKYIFKHVPYGKASKQTTLSGDSGYRFHFLLTRSKSLYVDAKNVYLDSSAVFTCFIMGFIARGDLGGHPRIRAVVVRDSIYTGPDGGVEIAEDGTPLLEQLDLEPSFVDVTHGDVVPPADYMPALEIAEAIQAERSPALWEAWSALVSAWLDRLRLAAGL
eukprot:tig00000640_g2760.t1